MKAEGRIPTAEERRLARQRLIGAFTLAEVLAALMIITVLASIAVGGAKHALTKAARSRAEAEIAAMETALENYKMDNGVYPPSTAIRDSGSGAGWGLIEINNSTNLFTALAGVQSGSKVYMTFKSNQIMTNSISGNNYYIVDPFGSPYNYYRAGMGTATATNSVTFDLWSYGPDGQNDTADDITNWKQ